MVRRLAHVVDEAAGAELGIPERYREPRLIGAGGMGLVYRAHDARLDRPVAIKVLRDGRAGAASRCLREARLQARVNHPNVCKVYDVVTVDQDRTYIVMQHIDGRGLGEAARTLSFEDRLRVAVAIAEAVEAAHALGLIHGDLKPGNVLVAAGPHPYVTDFGMAIDDGEPGKRFAGTPPFMAPELRRGDPLDRRSDLYGLGATLQVLFSAEGGVGPELERVLQRCLEPDPARRTPSAAALAQDLRCLLAGVPPAPRADGEGTALARFVAVARAPLPLPLRRELRHHLGLTVGREPGDGETLALPDPRLSRRHFRFEHEPAEDRWWVADLGSRHGVFVDGVRVERAPLSSGSVVRAASVLLVFGEVPREGSRPLATLDGHAAEPSLAMQRARAEIASLSRHAAPFAIVAEPGLRATALAQHIHVLGGRQGPFIAVAGGAFHAAAAPGAGSTLHLAGSIDDAELARALDACARSGARLSVALERPSPLLDFTLRVPPLRERREDILPWVDRLLGPETGNAGLSMEAAEALLLRPWSGNLDELGAVVKRAAAAAAAEGVALLEPRHLGLPS